MVAFPFPSSIHWKGVEAMLSVEWTIRELPFSSLLLQLTTKAAVAAWLGHLIVIFYGRAFRWHHFVHAFPSMTRGGSEKAPFYADVATAVKFWLSSLLLWVCLGDGLLTAQMGAILSLLLSVPQLIRANGLWHQKLRVVLGPLTPILAFNGLLREHSIGSVTMAIVSFLAFVVLRPDNDEVLKLLYNCHLIPSYIYEGTRARAIRTRLHGTLAAVNALLAFVFGIVLPFILNGRAKLSTTMGNLK
jgi:hypothetical protein